ncbi:hypothetical protein CHUAL_008468 [Chamberlinius hualienensis]
MAFGGNRTTRLLCVIICVIAVTKSYANQYPAFCNKSSRDEIRCFCNSTGQSEFIDLGVFENVTSVSIANCPKLNFTGGWRYANPPKTIRIFNITELRQELKKHNSSEFRHFIPKGTIEMFEIFNCTKIYNMHLSQLFPLNYITNMSLRGIEAIQSLGNRLQTDYPHYPSHIKHFDIAGTLIKEMYGNSIKLASLTSFTARDKAFLYYWRSSCIQVDSGKIFQVTNSTAYAIERNAVIGQFDKFTVERTSIGQIDEEALISLEAKNVQITSTIFRSKATDAFDSLLANKQTTFLFDNNTLPCNVKICRQKFHLVPSKQIIQNNHCLENGLDSSKYCFINCESGAEKTISNGILTIAISILIVKSMN